MYIVLPCYVLIFNYIFRKASLTKTTLKNTKFFRNIKKINSMKPQIIKKNPGQCYDSKSTNNFVITSYAKK